MLSEATLMPNVNGTLVYWWGGQLYAQTGSVAVRRGATHQIGRFTTGPASLSPVLMGMRLCANHSIAAMTLGKTMDNL